ncbi:MAG TPA: Gfo/Idh/MocA family oxidoreductase [Phycisphaerales bacterium]|nr:Gfo/Idh/MocA family oxidoreductase [Phycisphaerales bacterium]HMP37283.1 Gfo/Idh/MocA family oxidoreductase [Phycisphaerales bacterium]
MTTSPSTGTRAALSRREFLQAAAAIGASAFIGPALAGPARETTFRVLAIGVIGTIGGEDRRIIAAHPAAEIVGLCDVDSDALARAAGDHPDAFTCADYREAFDRHGDRFDGVIVATPDHAHCAMMTLALARGKHVYGQKPLVQQLEELELLRRAVEARPGLVTQVGAQRIESEARRAAVEILRGGALGKVIEVHVTFGTSSRQGGHYFADGILGDPVTPPPGFDYDLWLNGAAEEPCRPQMVQRQWRSWWNFGGGQITDWVVHLTDVLFYAFPELGSPTSVCAHTPSRDLSHFHADRVRSTLVYPVSGDRFAGSTCTVHFYDSGMMPDRAHLGVGGPRGEGSWPDGILTIVVCEGGTLVLAPSGPIEIWRGGEKTDGLAWPGLPRFEKFNHWHAWVDAALGRGTTHRWMPFDIGLRCTEPGLLAVKAARYPGQVLEWDRPSLTFTNHAEATRTLVRRDYRPEFAPTRLGAAPSSSSDGLFR